MLFHNISETPGYQFRSQNPWNDWEASIISDADDSLSRNFAGTIPGYDRIFYRGSFASDLGLAYQITKNPKYSQKAREALLNLDVGDRTNKNGTVHLR